MTNKFIKITKASLKGAGIFICAYAMNTSCKKTDTPKTTNTPPSYQQVNLVADTAGLGAARIDTNLANPWGIAISPTGGFWISTNHSGSTLIYDNTGAQLLTPVNIPLDTQANGASPSGVVYNSTTDFIIPGKGTSKYIYATEDGILSAWNSTTGSSTMTVADRSGSGAVYKGITISNNAGKNYIYTADFHNAKVDVYDAGFNYISSMPFNDPNIPAGFAPYNIQDIGGQLYVTYAKQKAPDNKDDDAGAGNGYVDIYTSGGVLVKRFASQGILNSPWAIVQPPASFGLATGDILIGNFGDGDINIYDANGNYQGQLMSNGMPVAIQGLWALAFYSVGSEARLYFTAGPDEEAHGLFGYLKKM